MNKKIIFVSVLSILMVVVLVYAQVLANDITVLISEGSKNALEKKGLTNIKTTDCIPISLDQCQYSMSNGTYRLGTHNIPIRYCDTFEEIIDFNQTVNGKCLSYTNYTTKEIEYFINNKSEEWLEDYGKLIIEREAKAQTNNDAKVLGGTVTFTQK